MILERSQEKVMVDGVQCRAVVDWHSVHDVMYWLAYVYTPIGRRDGYGDTKEQAINRALENK